MNNTEWVKVHVKHNAKKCTAKWTCLESCVVVKFWAKKKVKIKTKQTTPTSKYVMQTTIIIYYLHGTTCSSHLPSIDLQKNQTKD